jgi:hypothetical protein
LNLLSPAKFKIKKGLTKQALPHFVKAKGQNSNTFLEDLKRINALKGLRIS